MAISNMKIGNLHQRERGKGGNACAPGWRLNAKQCQICSTTICRRQTSVFFFRGKTWSGGCLVVASILWNSLPEKACLTTSLHTFQCFLLKLGRCEKGLPLGLSSWFCFCTRTAAKFQHIYFVLQL